MDQFTAQDWILIIGAAGLVINNAISNWKMSAKVDTVVTTAKIIEGHVNSAKTRDEQQALASTEREKRLEETIVELRKAAELLAQAKAIRDANTKIVIESSTRSSRVTDSSEVATDTAIPDASASTQDIKTLAAKLEIKPKSKS